MNLYIQLLMTLLRAWRAPLLAPGDTLERQWRVWPNDLDINGHMNNGRYLTIIDLMLIEYFVHIGFVRTMLKRRWKPMAGGSLISYRRGLQPFDLYTLRFRLAATDDHWNDMRFEFAKGDKVCAAGYVKGAAVGRGGLVPNVESYAAIGHPMLDGQLPQPVRDWIAAEQGVMRAEW